MKQPFPLSALLLASLLLSAPTAPAAILTYTGVSTADFTTPVNLTLAGNVDWAYWKISDATPTSGSRTPTNQKSGGAVIGAVSAVGGAGSTRGSTTSTTTGRYSWNDGSSAPLTGTNQPMAGLLFNSTIGATGLNDGIQLTLQGNLSQEYLVTLYLSGFDATGKLSLALGALTAGSPGNGVEVFSSVSPKVIDAYTFLFQPDATTGTALNIQYIASAVGSSGSSHVGIEAVTVAAVPEPGTAWLALWGVAAFLGRRRRI